MEGLQRATFPELRFYWSRFPTLCFKDSTILSSQKYIASWHFRTSFRIQRNVPSTGGRRAVDGPSHNQKLFYSKAAPAERGASYCAIHCTQSQAFSSLSENGTKGKLAAKEKLFENNSADLLSCKFNCNSNPSKHWVLLSWNTSKRNVTLNL